MNLFSVCVFFFVPLSQRFKKKNKQKARDSGLKSPPPRGVYKNIEGVLAHIDAELLSDLAGLVYSKQSVF